jgi:hypothetical protein
MWKDNLQRLFKYRRINPSANVWAQLDEQLAAHEATQAHKSKRRVWYYAAAASLLLLLGTTYLLKQEETTSPTSTVVVTEPKKVPNEGLEKELNKTIVVTSTPKHIQAVLPTKATKNVDKEIDSLLSDIKPNELLSNIMKDIVTDMYAQADAAEATLLKDLEKLSTNDLLMMASTEISLEKYVENQYNTDKILSETEVEIFKDRVQNLLDKIVNKFNEAKLALKQ